MVGSPMPAGMAEPQGGKGPGPAAIMPSPGVARGWPGRRGSAPAPSSHQPRPLAAVEPWSHGGWLGPVGLTVTHEEDDVFGPPCHRLQCQGRLQPPPGPFIPVAWGLLSVWRQEKSWGCAGALGILRQHPRQGPGWACPPKANLAALSPLHEDLGGARSPLGISPVFSNPSIAQSPSAEGETEAQFGREVPHASWQRG